MAGFCPRIFAGWFARYNPGMGSVDENVEQFNKGLYFDAHERWEKLWRAEEDNGRKALFQGMIKIAAAFHHLIRGEAAGAAKLLESGLALVQRHEELWETEFPGWNIGKFVKEVKTFTELRSGKALCANLPRIVRKGTFIPAH
ncbi:MAG: DUF309 domain-containing protein [Nitrospiraceae bacterium]|nr:DUF309 domain-containing protein [Nitrospiraceae bacterium]